MEDEGLLEKNMRRLLGRSWRTTLSGLIGGACMLAPQIPGLPPVILSVCSVVGPLVLGTGLAMAKDRTVSGLPGPTAVRR